MDEMVRLAMARWPNVPDCYGWLALDARGRWRIGHEREVIAHAGLNAFISRNYFGDENGCWLFQNGPQKVFVELDYTPWVWRLSSTGEALQITSHTQQSVVAPDAVWLDEEGRFLLRCAGQLGVVHDHDAPLLLDRAATPEGELLDDAALARAIEDHLRGGPTELALKWGGQTTLAVARIERAEVPAYFGFVAHPSPATGSHN
jgi:hypothetical protein